MPTDPALFELQGPDHLVYGKGSIVELPTFINTSDATALVITDQGIKDAKLLDPVLTQLDNSNHAYELFSDVDPDPPITNAEHCAELVTDSQADILIGVGGGSVLDITKAASILARTTKPTPELFGINKLDSDPLPTILIPTTAGTGSEVSQACVLRDESSGEKKGIVDDNLFAHTAIVDPDLSMELPPHLTAVTGLDAYAYAIGSYLSLDATPFADGISTHAIELIENNLRAATHHGSNAPNARELMALAATEAMFGRVNGGKSAIHSIAYGIQTLYHVPHGKAIAMVLPEVVSFNLPACVEKLARLGTQIYDASGSQRDQAEAVVDGLTHLRSDLSLDISLSAVGAQKEDMNVLVGCALQSDRHLAANPRPITEHDAQSILEKIW